MKKELILKLEKKIGTDFRLEVEAKQGASTVEVCIYQDTRLDHMATLSVGELRQYAAFFEAAALEVHKLNEGLEVKP